MTEPKIEIPHALECSECADYTLVCPGCDGSYGSISQADLLATARQHIAPMTDPQRALMDDMLRAKEHETHALFKEDFLNNDGAKWRELHQRRTDELHLRERFGLGDHLFGECCRAYVERVDSVADPGSGTEDDARAV